MNQMERRKIAAVERADKPEVKKERNFSRYVCSNEIRHFFFPRMIRGRDDAISIFYYRPTD